MKERPIIFSTELIPKILDGSKTQTRRVIKPSNSEVGEGRVDWAKFCWDGTEIHIDKCFTPNCDHKHEVKAPLPFVDTGFPNPTTGKLDSWYLHVPYHWADDCTIFRIYPKWEVGDRLWVRRTKDGTFIWKKSLAEIWLEITNIRVERLQEITEADGEAEGFRPWSYDGQLMSCVIQFACLWNSLNPKYSWEANPWVWVIEFKKI